MNPDDLECLNDEPWVMDRDHPVTFLVRLKGDPEPFGIVIARDRDELFWLIDELTDPYGCEVSVLVGGEGYFSGINNKPTMTEALEDRVSTAAAWRPVDDGTLFLKERAEKLSRRKKEVASLGRLLKDLGSKLQ